MAASDLGADATDVPEAQVPRRTHTLGAFFSRIDRFVAENFRLYGQLRKCRFAHWWQAFTEVFMTLFFTLLPLWVPLIAYPMTGNSTSGPNTILWDQVKNGELYIIASALLAPLYYFTFSHYKRGGEGARPFPSQQVLILVFIAILIVAVIAIVASKVTNAGSEIPRHMVAGSLYILLFCVLIYFLSLAAKNSIEEVTEGILDDQSRAEQENYPVDAPGNDQPVDADALVADVINKHRVA